MDIEVHPADASRWDDLVELFGPSGAYSGCWCMFWRVPGREFSAGGNAGNRAALRRLVDDGRTVGLLGYAAGRPVGWCTVAPRPEYGRITRSTTLRPDAPGEATIWAVPCFFVRRGRRRQGVAAAMLDAAVAHARARGARTLEGYPVLGGAGGVAELYTGTIGLFHRAGFQVHHRPDSGRRTVMRYAFAGSAP